MSDPLIEYERLWLELERSHKQIIAGHAIHVPTFHRTVKAFEASVLGVMSARQTMRVVKPTPQARACDGKQRFISRPSAQTHIANHPDREALEEYRCVFCSYWHYGNKQRMVAAQTSEARV